MNTILITGVCGGMGSAAAKLLLQKGYNVCGIDVAEKCHVSGVNYAVCDLTKENGLDGAITAFANQTFCAIIHFAGIYDMNSLIEMPDADFERIFKINVFGVYRVNKAFIDKLQPGGRIIITSSELAPLDPLPFTGIYGITKSALEKYAYSLRMELNLLGHYVSVIRPGAVDTGLLNVSTAALDKLCKTTTHYAYNTENFKNIVNSVESKSVPPQKIAQTALRALTAKHPKYVYNVNRNFLLKLLNVLPDRLQVKIIKFILTKKK